MVLLTLFWRDTIFDQELFYGLFRLPDRFPLPDDNCALLAEGRPSVDVVINEFTARNGIPGCNLHYIIVGRSAVDASRLGIVQRACIRGSVCIHFGRAVLPHTGCSISSPLA